MINARAKRTERPRLTKADLPTITTADWHRVTGVYIDDALAERLHWARFLLMWRRVGQRAAHDHYMWKLR